MRAPPFLSRMKRLKKGSQRQIGDLIFALRMRIFTMLIFVERKLVFLANPKTGSTAIEAALEPLASLAVQRPPALKHADLGHYTQFIAPWLHSVLGGGFTTVALMREPIDWLRSWYRFRLGDEDEDLHQDMDGMSFTEFAHGFATGGSSVHAGIRTQSAFLTNGAAQVDQIFRYEDIAAFTEFMENRLDCVLSLPRLNVPPEADVSLASDEAHHLRDVLAKDLALYTSL